jgi:2-amino-4-hydroxy-6-hydroxymethyldihydropteridine diphosphokinase
MSGAGTRAIVAAGSSIEPQRHLRAALVWLADRTPVPAVSRFFETPALDRPGDPPFVNGAFLILWDGTPRELKEGLLRPCEAALGRVRTEDRYAPRTLDLDIALFGDLEVDEPGLRIPDPDIGARAFVAVPACDVWPDAPVPGTGLTLREIAGRTGMESMTLLEGFTIELRALLNERKPT